MNNNEKITVELTREELMKISDYIFDNDKLRNIILMAACNDNVHFCASDILEKM